MAILADLKIGELIALAFLPPPLKHKCTSFQLLGETYSSVFSLSPCLLTQPILTFTPAVFANPSVMTAGERRYA